LGRENPRWGYLRIRGELLKLGIDVSHTTVATVLRQSGLGPAPRRIGPTWTEFLRLQAYGLLSDSSRSDQDDNPEDVASDPPEALTPVGEDPATTEHEEPVHEDPSAPSPRILVTVHAGRRACVTVVRSGVGVALATDPRWLPESWSESESLRPPTDLDRTRVPAGPGSGPRSDQALTPEDQRSVLPTGPALPAAIEFLYPTPPTEG
jgi:hypothetical protein